VVSDPLVNRYCTFQCTANAKPTLEQVNPMGSTALKPTPGGVLCVVGTAALAVVGYVFVLYTWPAWKHAQKRARR
jgi:hypothetical protein